MKLNEEKNLTKEVIITPIDSKEPLTIKKTDESYVDSLIEASFETSEEIKFIDEIEENDVIPEAKTKRN